MVPELEAIDRLERKCVCTVGYRLDGANDGNAVEGLFVGEGEGAAEGRGVGVAVGRAVGARVGAGVGFCVVGVLVQVLSLGSKTAEDFPAARSHSCKRSIQMSGCWGRAEPLIDDSICQGAVQ